MSLLPFASKPGGSGGGAPTGAQYVTLASDGTLSAERVLTAGNNITLTDAGANSTVTVAQSNATAYFNGVHENANAGFTLNALIITGFYLPYPVSASKLGFYVSTSDGVNSYDFAIYNSSGTRVAHTGAASYGSTGDKNVAFVEGTVVFTAGKYYIGWTGSATTLTTDRGGANASFCDRQNIGATTSGNSLASFTPPADAWSMWTLGMQFSLHS